MIKSLSTQHLNSSIQWDNALIDKTSSPILRLCDRLFHYSVKTIISDCVTVLDCSHILIQQDAVSILRLQDLYLGGTMDSDSLQQEVLQRGTLSFIHEFWNFCFEPLTCIWDISLSTYCFHTLRLNVMSGNLFRRPACITYKLLALGTNALNACPCNLTNRISYRTFCNKGRCTVRFGHFSFWGHQWTNSIKFIFSSFVFHFAYWKRFDFLLAW